MFALSMLFSEYKIIRNIRSRLAVPINVCRMEYEACRQKYCALFPTSKSVSQVVEINRNNSALKGKVMQLLGEGSIVRKRRVRNNSFQCLPYDYLVSWHSTKLECTAREEKRAD